MRLGLRILYWALVTPAGLVNRALGRDPLLLRRDDRRTTYWIPLTPSEGAGDYLSPADPANRPAGVAGWLSSWLRVFARRPDPAGMHLAEARPQDIPDEIYTLW
jgi:hypothetical protein